MALSFGAIEITAGSVRSDEVIAAIELPFGFRVEALSWTSDSSAANFDFSIRYGTVAATAGTSFLSADIALDSTGTGIARVSGTTPTINSGDVGSAAWNARTRPRSDPSGTRSYIQLVATTDVNGTAISFVPVVWGFPVDHVNLDPTEN